MNAPKILIADDVDYLVEYMISHLDKMLTDATYFRARNGYEVFTLAMLSNPISFYWIGKCPSFQVWMRSRLCRHTRRPKTSR
ncbi:hypothetical protein [Geofilum rubicundum]|uniref:Uncharacterized protein n=1 Tax=Geofilum rubicundum JCM 15548 TaxID=1236989 RepID=A0A0E9LYP4_9BACT|nr:hypothetical protein [Geofilum rubicundum]GAO29985.1 hypothetical protein JCM15548_12226 [Geofilum rubicundum JCM 15548]